MTFRLLLIVFLSTFTMPVFGESDDTTIFVNMALGESKTFKIKLPGPWGQKTHKVRLDRSALSSLNGADGIAFEIFLGGSDKVPNGELGVRVKAQYNVPSFEGLIVPIILEPLGDGDQESLALSLKLTIRPELTIGLWLKDGRVHWSTPMAVTLGTHKNGVLVRFVNWGIDVLKDPLRIHLQGHSAFKHSQGYETLQSRGDAYAYWAPGQTEGELLYREHYLESSSDLRSLKFTPALAKTSENEGE